jgi:hypothetical protein
MPDFSKETIEHVNSVGMHFSSIDTFGDQVLRKGIIYAGYNASTAKPNNKGIILNYLIQNGVFGKVEKILFMDDSIRNLHEVQNVVPDNINFTGVHFTEIRDEIMYEHNEQELDYIGHYQFLYLNNAGIIPNDYEFLYNEQCPIVPNN